MSGVWSYCFDLKFNDAILSAVFFAESRKYHNLKLLQQGFPGQKLPCNFSSHIKAHLSLAATFWILHFATTINALPLHDNFWLDFAWKISKNIFSFAGQFEHFRNRESVFKEYKPYFEHQGKNLSAVTGQSVHMPCGVRNLGDRYVIFPQLQPS